MTIDEMKKNIREYCLKLIINSKIEDWKKYDDSGKCYLEDNFIIFMSNSIKETDFIFKVEIYTNDTLKTKSGIVDFKDERVLFNRTRKKEIKILRKKQSEIVYYSYNKEDYEKTLSTYNLLPIKVLRKNKLEKINDPR